MLKNYLPTTKMKLHHRIVYVSHLMLQSVHVAPLQSGRDLFMMDIPCYLQWADWIAVSYARDPVSVREFTEGCFSNGGEWVWFRARHRGHDIGCSKSSLPECSKWSMFTKCCSLLYSHSLPPILGTKLSNIFKCIEHNHFGIIRWCLRAKHKSLSICNMPVLYRLTYL